MPKVVATLEDIEPYLVTRKVTRRLLGCSQSKIAELEKAGRLTPIKLTQTPNAVVHHRLDQVKALARGEGGAR